MPALAKDNKNSLTTKTLTSSDMRNTSRADAKSAGIALSTDMFDQGKYGATKAVTSTLLNNGKAKRQTIGKTVSAISTAQVSITDDQAQQVLTGKTAQKTINSINVDTIYTHLIADEANAEAAQQMAQTKQQLKQAVYQEAVKFTDEAYRTAYVEKVKIYKLLKDENGVVVRDKDNNPLSVELTDAEKRNLKPGKDGKVRVFNNGILNNKEAATKYTDQMANTGDGDVYLVHFPKADNALSELMVAGLQHFLEGGIADASNATEQNIELMKKYGKDGLDIYAHSRGTDTTGNAMQILAKDKNSEGVLANTNIHYFGPADNAQDAANQLDQLSNGKQTGVTLQNHKDDFVGGMVGGNQVTYGKRPEGSSKLKEGLKMFTEEVTVHSCYGKNRKDCYEKYGTPETTIIKSNRNTK